MECDVIVVGAGIGGLTTAALLAARGADVCVFERQSEAGGCVVNFEHLGYSFEPTFGIYSGWEGDGTWGRIFSELQVSTPHVTRLSPSYVVRLPDARDVVVSSDPEAFASAITVAFPDCADAALEFFRGVASGPKREDSAAQLLGRTSREFRWFIDAQLQAFAQCTSEECSAQRAADTLSIATGELWSITGGAQTLADRLVESLKKHGGTVRLNSPVLRMAYGTDGRPIGVDLLNGERVVAKQAIVSNLTIWDTYGKLIGLGRTPRNVAIELKKQTSWGAYLMFLSIDEAAAATLPAPRAILVHELLDEPYDPERQQLMLNLPSGATALAGKRSLTAIAFSRPDEWFSFHEDQSWHEQKDQAALETFWTRLHQALPSLGDAVEVIETSTPQTVYEQTRRRLGMIGAPAGVNQLAALLPPFDNVFLVSDTVSTGFGLEGVAETAVAISQRITPRRL